MIAGKGADLLSGAVQGLINDILRFGVDPDDPAKGMWKAGLEGVLSKIGGSSTRLH